MYWNYEFWLYTCITRYMNIKNLTQSRFSPRHCSFGNGNGPNFIRFCLLVGPLGGPVPQLVQLWKPLSWRSCILRLVKIDQDKSEAVKKSEKLTNFNCSFSILNKCHLMGIYEFTRFLRKRPLAAIIHEKRYLYSYGSFHLSLDKSSLFQS